MKKLMSLLFGVGATVGILLTSAAPPDTNVSKYDSATRTDVHDDRTRRVILFRWKKDAPEQKVSQARDLWIGLTKK